MHTTFNTTYTLHILHEAQHAKIGVRVGVFHLRWIGTIASQSSTFKLYDGTTRRKRQRAGKSWQELASHAVKAFQAFLFWLELSVGRAPSAAHLVRVQMAPEGARGREWNLEQSNSENGNKTEVEN